MYTRMFEATVTGIGDYSLGNVFRVLSVVLDDGDGRDLLIKCDLDGVMEAPTRGTRVLVEVQEVQGIWIHRVTHLETEEAQTDLDLVVQSQLVAISLLSRRT